MADHVIEAHAHYARIDVNDYFELRSWAKRFGVTAGEVRRAVSAVGDRAADVETRLKLGRPARAASEDDSPAWPR